MLKGFKDFIMRGNVVDLAVAVVIGAAFSGIVTTFTSKIINPIIAALGGQTAGNGLGISLRSDPRNPKLAQTTFVDFGALITAAINFMLIAAVIYFVFILPMNTLRNIRRRKAEVQPEQPPEDIELLREIRDLLRQRPIAR